MSDDAGTTAGRLADPFDVRDVKFKPQMVKANRCLAMPYVDARVVQDRLDEVLGAGGWWDSYDVLPDGTVTCRLTCVLDGGAVSKMDVGAPSEQPDAGDRMKAAFSDALKRAAVKFGVGRYLYRLSSTWVDYDPVKKQIPNPPALPDWATPGGVGRPASARPAGKPAARKPAAAPPEADPRTGPELLRRMEDAQRKLHAAGRCGPTDVVDGVRRDGQRLGWVHDVRSWEGGQVTLATQWVRAMVAAFNKAAGGERRDQPVSPAAGAAGDNGSET